MEPGGNGRSDIEARIQAEATFWEQFWREPDPIRP